MTDLLFSASKQIENHFNPDAELVLYHGDVADFLSTLPGNSVRLIVTSPPYNLGKDYENRVSIEKYLSTQEKIIAQL